MRRNCVFMILLLAVSLFWVLYMQDQSDVFTIDPTADLPEMMMQADVVIDADESEYGKPVDAVDPIALPASPQITLWFAFINVKNRPCINHTIPVWPFLINNPPTAPPRRLKGFNFQVGNASCEI
jgi:hypothetical protein